MTLRSIEVLLKCDGCNRYLHVEVSAWDWRLCKAEVAEALGEQEWTVGPARNTHWCLACTHQRSALTLQPPPEPPCSS